MRQSKYVIYAEYKKHLDGDWRTVHNLWRHIRNYAGVFGYSKVEVDAFFEGESGGKKQVDAGNVIGLTQNSVPFASAGGALTEDNANFNYVSGTKTLSVDTMAFTGGSITDSSNLITFGDDVALTEGEGLAIGGTPVADTILIETSNGDDPTLSFKTTQTAHQVNIILDESAVADHIDIIGQTAAVDTLFHVIGKAGQSAKVGVQIGSYRGELICGSAGHISLKNVTEDKDLIFGIDDGGVAKTIKWDASADILIHSAGTFNIQGLIAMDTAVATAISIGNSFTGSQVTFIGSSATDHAIEISGLYSAALIYTHTSSGTADTLLWGDMASTATAGAFDGLRPRLTCNAASGGLNARAVYAEVIVGASKYAALAQGVLAHVSYAAGSCTITDIHALGVHISQGASLNATNLYGLIITVQTRGDETITGDDYMIRLNNEAVGGNGRQMDGAIQIVDTNLGGAIIGYGYGIDMNGATIATADIRLQNGETISNAVDGLIDFSAGNLKTTGTFTASQCTVTADGVDTYFVFDADVGKNSDLRFQKDTVNRWIMRCDSTAESGGNAGSNFTLISRTDAGGILGYPLFIERATGNIGFNTVSFGANMTKGLSMVAGVAPTNSPADCFQVYSADIIAGHAACHIRNENNTIIKLYQQAHIIDADGQLADITTKFNTLLSYLENNGLLASA